MLNVYFEVFYDVVDKKQKDVKKEEILNSLNDHFIKNINKIAYLNLSDERKMILRKIIENEPQLLEIRKAYQNSKFLGAVLSIFKDYFEFIGIIDNSNSQKKKENLNTKTYFGFLTKSKEYLELKIDTIIDALKVF